MQQNTPAITKQRADVRDGPVETTAAEGDMKVTVEKELVSQAEEEDMEALLGMYVLISSSMPINFFLYIFNKLF